MKEFKDRVVEVLLQAIEQRISDTRAELDSLQDSRNSATKSTAGDKHETGRAMMQQEVDQQEKQLAAAVKMKADLSQIDISPNSLVKTGSLIKTSSAYFFIAVPFGKLMVDEQVVQVISPIAPICAQMIGKQKGDKIKMGSGEIELMEVC